MRFLILFIWFVTAYDVYCLRVLEHELNPLADLIIKTWGLWAFAGVKIFGTALATEWLRVLKPFYTYVIATLYLMLLVFLWSF